MCSITLCDLSEKIKPDVLVVKLEIARTTKLENRRSVD